MRKIFLLLLLSFAAMFAQAQNVSGDELRIYKGASIGEDGIVYPLDMNGNKITNVQDPIALLDAVNLQYFQDNMSLTQPLDSLSLKKMTNISTDYTLFADSLAYGGAFKTGLGDYVYKLGQATVLLYYNDNAYPIEAFDILHLKGGALVDGQLYPTPELADASDWEKTQGTLSVAAHAIPAGEFGFSVIYGVLKGGSTLGLTAGEQVWLSADGSGDITTTRPEFQNYAISIGGVFNSVAAPDGQIFVNVTRDIYDTFNDAWDGAIRETFNFMTSSDGVNVTGTLANVIGSNDLTLIFSDGFYTFDTTPAATLTLVAGTSTSVQMNYVYIDKATKTLQTSTGSFPATEHAKIAVIGILDAASTQTRGALRNQNVNDHIKKEGNNGHILHIAERLRQFNAEWDSGAETTLTGTPTNVYFSNTSGIVYQLHPQTFEAQNMAVGDDIHVVNDPTSPYRATSNLNDITVYSDGSSWNNNWSNLVVWGVANRDGEISHLMVNLPSNGYLSEEDAFNDAENYSNYTIPKDFKGVGFLIGRYTIRRSSATFTYNVATGYLDLRGFIPNNTAGSGGGASGITTFAALTDTPNSYIGFGGEAVTVTSLEDGLEFSPVVTSVNGQSPTLGNYNITSTANKVGEDVTIGTGGTGIDAAFSVADNDNSTSNELQDLGNSKLNNDVTVTISNGTNTTISNIARTDFLNPQINALSIQTGGIERIDATGNIVNAGSGTFSGIVSRTTVGATDSFFEARNGTNFARLGVGANTTSNALFMNLNGSFVMNVNSSGNVSIHNAGVQKLITTTSGINVTGSGISSDITTSRTNASILNTLTNASQTIAIGYRDTDNGYIQGVSTTNIARRLDINPYGGVVNFGGGIDVTGTVTATGAKLTAGAAVDKVWTCTNVDGSGEWGDAIAAQTLQSVLNSGNTATQDMELTGTNVLTKSFIVNRPSGTGSFGIGWSNSISDLVAIESVGNLRIDRGGFTKLLVDSEGVKISDVLKLESRLSAPSSPSLGWIYANSTDNHIYFYNGSTWVQLDN